MSKVKVKPFPMPNDVKPTVKVEKISKAPKAIPVPKPKKSYQFGIATLTATFVLGLSSGYLIAPKLATGPIRAPNIAQASEVDTANLSRLIQRSLKAQAKLDRAIAANLKGKRQ